MNVARLQQLLRGLSADVEVYVMGPDADLEPGKLNVLQEFTDPSTGRAAIVLGDQADPNYTTLADDTGRTGK